MLCVLVSAAVDSSVSASTHQFTIRSFEADFYLDKDKEGRSTLKTVEKITAVFPEFDQNHGIERAIPKDYDGHTTSLKVESVKDGEGKDLPYSDRTSNDNLVLRIGDADKYVHGVQHYTITYTQRDVTRFFGDTNADEFYWDVNGTGWLQSMDEIRAVVHVSPSIASQLNGKATCYEGLITSTKQCPVERSDADGVKFSASRADISAYENVTIALGFAPRTFKPYQQHPLLTAWFAYLLISSLVAIILIILLSIRYMQLMNRAKGSGTVTVEYLPPKDTNVLVSAYVIRNSTSDITAQLIDLAVRHYIKIYQTKEKRLFSPAEYELEIAKDLKGLQHEEIELLEALFGKSNTRPGSRFAMKQLRNNTQLAQKLLQNRALCKHNVRHYYGLYERASAEAKGLKRVGFWALAVGLVTLSPLVVIAAIVAFIFSALAWPLTEKGAELRDYLVGLKEYISVAETERLKMLQSPEGAEKVGVKIDENNTKQLVKLYERVLPYAVLFGIEKEWTRQLGTYYASASMQPDWYAGSTAFNAAVFSSSLGSFTSQASSYSSSASSSSGGSDGGGSSGGGGGGGGGGGW